MAYLLDTSILILAARNSPAWRNIDSTLKLTQSAFRPAISIVTHGELLAFSRWRGWGSQKVKTLEQKVGGFVVIPIDDQAIVEQYAALSSLNKSSGLNIGQNDLWIASTAVHYNLALLTTDGDFDRCPPPLSFIRFDQQTGAEITRR